MLRILVVFSSSEGQTEKVAHHVARQIENKGCAARLVSAHATDDAAAIGDFDAAIVAGALHMGAHGPALATFISEHADALNAAPSAFLSVSLSAASDDPADVAGALEAIKDFEAATGWTPRRTQLVAGAVHDRQMGFFKRLLIHTLMARKGVELDPSGNTEFTKWPTLDRFIGDFVDLVEKTAAGGRTQKS
jgi:menaquinone-dependent protoporphyrinogen oxidase